MIIKFIFLCLKYGRVDFILNAPLIKFRRKRGFAKRQKKVFDKIEPTNDKHKKAQNP